MLTISFGSGQASVRTQGAIPTIMGWGFAPQIPVYNRESIHRVTWLDYVHMTLV